MEKGLREINIKRIIDMEERIVQCNRCPELTRCIRKPSLGKGDLQPQIVMVFECENEVNRENEQLLELRRMVKEQFETGKIYHTYMVRCQPKSCSSRQNTSYYLDTKLIDKNYACILTNRVCDGIAIKPGNEQIMSCLPFLLEELQILKAPVVILFGHRVAEYVLKSCGVYVPVEIDQSYRCADTTYLVANEERYVTAEECHRLFLLSDMS